MFFHRNSSTERLENYLYDRDRKRILLMVSSMGERTARALEEAVEALVTLDGPRAAAVVAQDGAIDALEGEIEQECLLSLAMRQPVREDLRFVFSVLKIVTDLERLGDEAANISEKTMALLGAPLFQPLVDIPQMGNLVAAMLRDSLQAFAQNDAPGALEVIRRDDVVDTLYDKVFRDVMAQLIADGIAEDDRVRRGAALILISRYLERAGDHAVNIATRAYFMITGKRLPDRHEARRSPAPEKGQP